MKKLPEMSKMEEPMELTEDIARYILKLQAGVVEVAATDDCIERLPAYSDEAIAMRRRLESWFPVLKAERLAGEDQAANKVFKKGIIKLGDEIFKRGGLDTVLSTTWDGKLADVLRFDQAVDELRGSLIRLAKQSGGKADDSASDISVAHTARQVRKGLSVLNRGVRGGKQIV